MNNDINYKKVKSEYNIEYEDSSSDDDINNRIFEIKDTTFETNELISDKKLFISLLIKFFDKNILKIFKNKKDIKIAYAILEILINYEYIENFNKKNIYILIREMTDCNASNITKVLNRIKEIYIKLLNEFNATGNISLKYNNE